MRLQNNLYDITNRKISDDCGDFRIRLDKECFIYKAHFPGQPITPGVCTIQIAVELAEDITGTSLRLSGVRNVKFLAVISPAIMPEITYSINIKTADDGDIKVQAVAKSDTEVFAKMSLICKR